MKKLSLLFPMLLLFACQKKDVSSTLITNVQIADGSGGELYTGSAHTRVGRALFRKS